LDFTDLGFEFEGTCSDTVSSAEEPSTPEPQIDIEQAVNGSDADSLDLAISVQENQQLSWTYKVINTGNVELTEIQVKDNMLGAIECPQDDLVVGESMTCTAYGAAAVGEFSHEACAKGDYLTYEDAGVTVTTSGDCDTSYYIGTLREEKAPELQEMATLKIPSENPIP
jgi:hypothetical protein